jgi:hypothetical protein
MSERQEQQSYILYTQIVQRKVPVYVQIIRFALYFCVVLFTIIGTMAGPLWGMLAISTLLFAWYVIGSARVTYRYQLEGTTIHVTRISGFKGRPHTEQFAELELKNLELMAPEDSRELDALEAETSQAVPKRIVYDVSAHDPSDVCDVMFLKGTGEEAGRWLKVYFQPSPEMKNWIRRLRPGKMVGYPADDQTDL